MFSLAFAQNSPVSRAPVADPGRRQYDNNYWVCHGGDGEGGELAPSILFRLPSLNDSELPELFKTLKVEVCRALLCAVKR